MQNLKWNELFFALNEVQAINFIAPQTNLLYRLKYNMKEGENEQESLWNLQSNILEEGEFKDLIEKSSIAKYLIDLMLGLINTQNEVFNIFSINSPDKTVKSLIIIWSNENTSNNSINNERLIFFKEFLEYYEGKKVPTLLPWNYLRKKMTEENNNVDFSCKKLEFPIKFNGDSKEIFISDYNLFLNSNGKFKLKSISTGEVAIGKYDSDIIVSSEEFFEEIYHSFPPYIF
jgi:hypothetical protein